MDHPFSKAIKRGLFAAGLALSVSASCVGSVSDVGGPDDPLAGPGQGSGTGNAADPGGIQPASPLPGRDLAPTIGIRRLTIGQYNNTIQDLLADKTTPASGKLPADPYTKDAPFASYDSQETQLGDPLIGTFETLATSIAAALMKDTARRDKVIGCKGTDPTCLRAFVTRFGRRAFRRPLTEEDISAYLQIPARTGSAGDFYASVEDIVRTFLQDLEFLYRVEIGSAVQSQSGLFKLGRFELATRLSYLLVNSTPPDWLLEHVEKENGLSTAADIRAVARRLLTDPRARDQLASFHALWLGYATLVNQGYPLVPDMMEETKALIGKMVFDDKKPWQDLLRSTGTIVSYDLSVHYGLKQLPAGFQKGSRPTWVSYEGTPRRGLLSQGTILNYGNKFGDTSPVQRGKAIKERLFCQTVQPPPANLKVNTDEAPKPLDNSLCKWNRYAPQTTRPECSGCHRQMNPVGFGLENFDARGRYRTEQWWKADMNGVTTLVAAGTAGAERCPIVSNGEINGQHFGSPGELADILLKDSEGLTRCLMKNLYQFASGRGRPDAGDDQVVGMLAARTGGKDFDFVERILDIVTSDAFSHRHVAN